MKAFYHIKSISLHKSIVYTIFAFIRFTTAFAATDTIAINNKLDSANLFYNQGIYKNAIALAVTGAQLSTKLNYIQGIARSHNILANVYLRQGDFSKANAEALITLKANEAGNNKKGMCQSFLLLGNIFFSTSELEKAKAYFKKSLMIAKDIQYNTGIAKLYMNLGVVFIEQKNKDSALYYLNDAIKVLKLTNDTANLSSAYANIGVIYFDDKQWALSLENYQQAEKLALANNDQYTLASLKINIGSIFYEQGNLPIAKRYITKGLKLSRQIDAIPVVAEAHSLLAGIYEKEQQYRKALFHFKISKNLADSMVSAEKMQAIADINSKYESEKKDKAISLLNKEKELQQLAMEANTKKQTNNIILIISCFLLALLVLMFLLYTHRQKQLSSIKSMENERVTAELVGLKSQLNPHVLFNSLNTIYFQIDQDTEAAKQTILKYADILRYQLYKSNVDFIDIATEIEYLKKFIDIQQLRMSQRCQLNVTIDDELKEQKIAPLLIITIVENAFKHVTNLKERNNYIAISLRKTGKEIELITENSAFNVNAQNGTGTDGGLGLVNLKKRLQLIYPNQHSLEYFFDQDIFHVKLLIHAR